MEHVRQCPCCPVRFAFRTELDWHLRDEHPQFRHDYAGRSAPDPEPLPPPAT